MSKWSPEARARVSEQRKVAYAEGRRRLTFKKMVVPVIQVSDEFGYWFSGLVDGEGCFYFSVQKGNVGAGFSICMRCDDAPMLEYINRTLGVGNTGEQITATTVATSFRVGAFADCVALKRLFDRYPLQSKKRYDFLLWSEIVEAGYEYGNLKSHTPWVADVISAMKVLRRPEWTKSNRG